ncbi:MAG: hypothetical protein IKK33_12675 [Lachnospiraceae bacterium]|nr:hypothetical protein [Lachnospiraceae bacterium]
MEQSATPKWMNDPLVQDISKEKLNFLSKLFVEGKGKSQKEMMAFFLPMIKKAKAENLSFTQSEISACIQAIKNHSTQDELNQINKLMAQHNK